MVLNGVVVGEKSHKQAKHQLDGQQIVRDVEDVSLGQGCSSQRLCLQRCASMSQPMSLMLDLTDVTIMRKLYDHKVFIGQVGTREMSVPRALTQRGRRRTEQKTLLSLQLNLSKRHSHPEFRNTLHVIDVLVGLLRKVRSLRSFLRASIEAVPIAPARNYLRDQHDLVLDKLHRNFLDALKATLAKLLTDYIRSVAEHNELGDQLANEVAVNFGSLLPVHIVCGSDALLGMHERAPRVDEQGFAELQYQFKRLSSIYGILIEALETSRAEWSSVADVRIHDKLYDFFQKSGKKAKRSLVRSIYSLENPGAILPRKLSRKLVEGDADAVDVAVLASIVPVQLRNFRGLSKLITTQCQKAEDVAA